MEDQPGASTTLKQLGMRACGTCVKAKARCVLPSEGRKCQRCHRLDKECRRASPGARKKPKSSQVAQLEEKLDNIVTLLISNKSQAPDDGAFGRPSGPPSLSSGSQSTPISDQETNVNILDEMSMHVDFSNLGHESAPSHFQPSLKISGPSPQVYDFNIQSEEAESLLTDFRNNMARHIPFVVVPPLLTSEALCRDRPLLWKSIIIAALYCQPDRQEVLGAKFMEELSTKLLLKAEKSLDLLQGILVHLCWYHYHVTMNPQVMNLLLLITALVTNLGYLRPRSIRDCRQPLMEDIEDPRRTSQNTFPLPGSEIREQWRAVAGCFAIISISANNCRGMNSIFRFSSQINENAKKLAELPEYESDKAIYQLCRLQNIALKISNLYQDGEDGLASIPIMMYSKVLQEELERFKADLPPDLQDDDMLMAHYQLAEINLYEWSLYSTFYPNCEKAHRLSALYSGLLAVKSFFTTYFVANAAFSPSDPLHKWVQMGYVLLMAFRFCICTADGWDRDHARKVLQFPAHLDALATKLEVAIQLRSQCGRSFPQPHASYGSCRPDIFNRFLRQVRRFKAWYESMLVAETSQEITEAACPAPQSFQLNSQDTDMAMDEFSSENALADIDSSLWQCLMIDNENWLENWYAGTTS